MKLYKSFLLVAAFVGLFSSCSEESYWDAYDTQEETTYCMTQTGSSYKLKATDELRQVVVTFQRNKNNTTDTIPLSIKVNSDIITVAQDYTVFEDGKYTSDLVINIDNDNIAMGVNYSAEIEFLVDSVRFFEHNYSITGSNKYTLSFVKDYTWVSLGKALYTDDVVNSPGFGLPEIVTYKVETEQALEKPELIRLKNAYGAIYPYNEDGDYDTEKDYYITLNIADLEGIYIDGWCEMGMDWGYGMFSVTSYGWYMMDNGYSFEVVKANGLFGTMNDDLVITFPVKGLVMQMADWGMTYANLNGAAKIDLSTTTIEL